MDKKYSAEDLANKMKVISRKDLGLDSPSVVLDVVYKGEQYSIGFEKVDPPYLSGDWVAQQEGRDYTTDWGIADNDRNLKSFNYLAAEMVDNGVIKDKDKDEAFNLVRDAVEPYLDSPDAEHLAQMGANYADFVKGEHEHYKASPYLDDITKDGLEDLTNDIKITGWEDLGLDSPYVVLDIVYKGEQYSIGFYEFDPPYLSGDWVAQQAGQEYTTDWGVAEDDNNLDSFSDLADKMIENGVINDKDEAFKLVRDAVTPYIRDVVEPFLNGPEGEELTPDGGKLTPDESMQADITRLKLEIEAIERIDKDKSEVALFVDAFDIAGKADIMLADECTKVWDSACPAESIKDVASDAILDTEVLRAELVAMVNREDLTGENSHPTATTLEALVDKFDNDPDFREAVKSATRDIVSDVDLQEMHNDIAEDYYAMTATYLVDDVFEPIHNARDDINKGIIAAYNSAIDDLPRDAEGYITDEDVFDKFEERKNCAEIRMESDAEAEDLLRGMYDYTLVNHFVAIQEGRTAEPYGYTKPETSDHYKAGYQITEEGAANFICDNTLQYSYEDNENRIGNPKNLAINSSDISVLKTYNPALADKLHDLKANCYSPIYVEPEKVATPEVITKSKDTGISL